MILLTTILKFKSKFYSLCKVIFIYKRTAAYFLEVVRVKSDFVPGTSHKVGGRKNLSDNVFKVACAPLSTEVHIYIHTSMGFFPFTFNSKEET